VRLVGRTLGLLAWAGLVAGITGCSSVRKQWDVPSGPAFKPTNFTSSGPIPVSVRRVAVLPLHSDTWDSADLAGVESSFLTELGKFERFEIVPVSRLQMREQFGAATVVSSAALPADVLARLRASFGADAILFQDLTQYSPYQPISMGARAKLVSAIDGRVLWAFDAIFDGGQPSVAVAAHEYYMRQGRPSYPLENSAGIMQSPSRFAKYVAYAMFGTLPPRQTR
jgi:hypothetical protein